MPVGVVAAGLLGLVIGFVALRPLRRRNAPAEPGGGLDRLWPAAPVETVFAISALVASIRSGGIAVLLVDPRRAHRLG